MSAHTAHSSETNRPEYTAAFLVLRLWLGLRTLFAGLEKFESGGSFSFENYYKNMARMAGGISGASLLPLWATKTFAFFLGYLLVIFGLSLLVGFKTRFTLFMTGLLYTGLSFGLMAVQEAEGVAWLGVHVALVAFALVLVRHNRFALSSEQGN
jgi:thiosulfate dehydrogenase [quinone] large subunit